jgi:hypothetical protein
MLTRRSLLRLMGNAVVLALTPPVLVQDRRRIFPGAWWGIERNPLDVAVERFFADGVDILDLSTGETFKVLGYKVLGAWEAPPEPYPIWNADYAVGLRVSGNIPRREIVVDQRFSPPGLFGDWRDAV